MLHHVTKIIVCLLIGLLSSNQLLADYRTQINLASDNWQEAISDTINVTQIPMLLIWDQSQVPTIKKYSQILQSSDPMWMYCNVKPEDYLKPDGTFKVVTNRSVWLKRTINIPADMLQNRTVHLSLAGASYRSGYFVNGQFVAESIQATLPIDLDITKQIKPGNNEILIALTTREGLIDPKAKVYIAPSMGATFGLRGPIRLEFRPKIAVEDVFVKTSVSQKHIDFQTTLINNTSTPAKLKMQVDVRSARDPLHIVGTFTSDPITIAGNQTVVTHLKENWVTPILWSLTTPEMYIADISLMRDDRKIDSYQQSFGFREFATQGKDLLLNGQRVVMLRESSLTSLKTLEQLPEETSITRRSPSINSIRQHLGAYNADLIHQANERGIMVVPESSYSWTKIFPHDPEQAKVWLPGVLDYYKQWAKHLRNEPSVVMYSLTNETYWERNRPEEMAVAKQIIKVMREHDPTRPLQGDGDNYWNGLLDVINIHYPEGTAGTLRKKYPNSGLMVPNDIHWLTDEGGVGWRTDFKWDRPLILGEFGGGGDWESYSSYGGDDVYNWIKWRGLTRSGYDRGMNDPQRENYYQDTMRKMVNFYRHMGVAGLNPWTGDNNELLKRAVVAPIDFHPNVNAGGVFERKVAIFNDGVTEVTKLQYLVKIGNQLVCDQSIEPWVGTGRHWSGTIKIPIPDCAEAVKAELTMRIFWKRGSQYRELDYYTEDIYIVPNINLSSHQSQIALVDPNNSLKSLLDSLQLDNVVSLNTLDILDHTRLLIIGTDAFDDKMKEQVDAFVQRGGVALVLPQKGWQPYRSELPERDDRHATTQCWIRSANHPALKHLEEAQLSYWLPDNVMSYQTFSKPKHGPQQAIIDSGGRFGLSWTPLLDIPIGKGAYVMTTLQLTDAEPAARQLLANLITYGCNRQQSTYQILNVLAGSNTKMQEVLTQVKVVKSEGMGHAGPILVDGSADVNMDELKSALNQGRILWLHGFTPKTFNKIKDLFPADAKLKAINKELIGTMSVAPQDPLFTGIPNYDLAWYIPKMYYGGPIFDDAKVVAKNGDWILDTNYFAENIKQLTAPALMVKIQSGNGTILFDTLQWEHALAQLPEKSLRLVSRLLANMQCQFINEKQTFYQYSFVDLSEHANMGYIDQIADDGVGGWTDQGENDMRFFLINHSGKGNGRENGMDVPIPDFPTHVTFAGIPVQLVDPKANNDKAVLSFGSPKHGSKLMRQVSNIAINRKADAMWFVHCIGWSAGNPGDIVAQYTVIYDDGSSTVIPIKRFMDAGDWFTPTRFSNAKVAWTGKNLEHSPVGLNISKWDNPHPEKRIKTVSINAGMTDSQYVLLAITCGRF